MIVAGTAFGAFFLSSCSLKFFFFSWALRCGGFYYVCVLRFVVRFLGFRISAFFRVRFFRVCFWVWDRVFFRRMVTLTGNLLFFPLRIRPLQPDVFSVAEKGAVSCSFLPSFLFCSLLLFVLFFFRLRAVGDVFLARRTRCLCWGRQRALIIARTSALFGFCVTPWFGPFGT
ncbi:hypothetical protein B0H19DRAFT_1138405 [Mycena capillaripes]|nr:hypothetical protein B0H19DRAFT_1138405 [Mycena capillaripes]